MTQSDQDESELVRAAAALERELTSLEGLARSVRKIRLDSQKSIARASKELNEALAVPERLGAGLQTLATAMAQMQARQQTALDALANAANQIQERMEKLGRHMQAFAALGLAAGEVGELLQTEGDAPAARLDAHARLGRITEGARELLDAARADDFPEVAREADALKQRVAALRKRLDPPN